MRFYVGPRGSGKTEQMIRESAKEWLYIVCDSHQTSYALAERARALGLTIPFPITYDVFLHGGYCGKQINGFIVEDIELLLAQIARIAPVKYVTVRGPELVFDDESW